MVRRVARRLADLALRRPWALLGANLAVLVAALALAVGAPSHLGIGSLRLTEPPATQAGKKAAGGADIVIVTRGQVPADSRVYRVALGVMSSQITTDPGVEGVDQGPVGKDHRTRSLDVTLNSSSEADRQKALFRIEDAIDPGPLEVTFGGELAALDDARANLSDDFWRLELLIVPLALLVLVTALGPRLAVAPVICAATAIAGSLALLRLASLFFGDVSLVGAAPAVLGLALGIELPSLLVAHHRSERARTSRDEAVRRAVAGGARPAALAALAAGVVPLGLLATPLEQAPSIVFGCAAAAALAVGSALTCGPALIVLARPEGPAGTAPLAGEPQAPRGVAAAVGWLAARRWRSALCAVLAVAAALALARPALDGETRPFTAADLPADSPAHVASERLAAASPAPVGQDDSLFEDLPLAAGVSAAALALVLLAAFRSIRAVPLAIVALLPAAAAIGLCVLVFQQGHLASEIGQDRQGWIETGALACAAAALVAISAARCSTALSAARMKRPLVLPARIAAASAQLTLPTTLAATLITGAATGVLAGTDLYAAREFGLAIAAGLVVDLVLIRPSVLVALSRWAAR
jgi:hypothetical protein